MALNPLLATTTIVDRTGRRIGTYLVDRSKDSLDREKREQRDPKRDEEAVVMHHSGDFGTETAQIDVEADPLTGVAVLDVKA
jgi:hypothetical protein